MGEEMAALTKEKEEREAAEAKMVEERGIVDGARAEITIQGSGKRRGTVRFVGPVHFQPGTWVGIQYDEPTGKNDGSVGDTRYFTCQAKYGGFVRPAAVQVGDFPEEDLDFSDERCECCKMYSVRCSCYPNHRVWEKLIFLLKQNGL